MKRCSTLYAIRVMQSKTRYCCTPMRMAKIQNTDSSKCQQKCGTTGTLIHCWWECKTVQHLKDILAVSYKIELGIYPKLKSYVHTITCVQMIIAALFTIVKIWMQTRCPSVDKEISKLQYIHTLGDLFGNKRNELSSHKNTWRNFKYILISERSQSVKTTYYMIVAIKTSRKEKTTDRKKISGYRSLKEGGWKG